MTVKAGDVVQCPGFQGQVVVASLRAHAKRNIVETHASYGEWCGDGEQCGLHGDLR